MGAHKSREKTKAYFFYVSQDMTAKEVAEKTGVTEKTVGKWVKQGNWRENRVEQTKRKIEADEARLSVGTTLISELSRFLKKAHPHLSEEIEKAILQFISTKL